MVVGDIATMVEVVVFGAGPGGYAAALRAAQLGKEVLVIDPRLPGGTHLHQGGIPTNALLTAAHRYTQLSGLAEIGIPVETPPLNWTQLQNWKNNTVQRLSTNIRQLFKEHNIDFIQARGRFLEANEIIVEAKYGAQHFIFEHAVIAVGGSPKIWPDRPFDGHHVITPAEALALPDLPAALTVVGNDYVAVELALLFAKLGSHIVLQYPDHQLPLSDFPQAATQYVQQELDDLGVELSPITETHPSEVLIVSTGLKPNTDQLALDHAGVVTDEAGFVLTNDRMQTTNSAIYAAGDVTGGPAQAHLALRQGKIAAENIAGLASKYWVQAVPRIIWTEPQIAAVGLTAEEAESKGYQVVTGRFPLGNNARALTLNAPEGFVLTVAEQGSEVLLGFLIISEQAESLIGEAALALEMGATLTDLAETLHPHPGLGEALQESAENALGSAIHIFTERNPSDSL